MNLPKKNMFMKEVCIVFAFISLFIVLFILSGLSLHYHKRLNQLENDVSYLIHKDLPAPGIVENSKFKRLPKNLIGKHE